MTLKNLLFLAVLTVSTALVAPGCKSKPKDADVKAKVEAAVGGIPGVSVEVKDGMVTLSGEVTDETSKTAAEAAAKALDKEGVAGVTNNLSVAPPPPPVMEPAPAVEITDDAALTASVNAAVKAYPKVQASVNGGVIVLTGEIKRAELGTLMPVLSALKPKKIENQLVIK